LARHWINDTIEIMVNFDAILISRNFLLAT
jgi:hypothetical protein